MPSLNLFLQLLNVIWHSINLLGLLGVFPGIVMAVAAPCAYTAASIVFILVMSPQNLDLKHYIIAFCHAVGNFIFEYCQGLAVARP